MGIMDKRLGAIAALGLIAITVSTFNGSALSSPLLPSQEEPNIFSAQICRDRAVISIIKSSIDYLLKTKTAIAKGMQTDDIRLEEVMVDKRVMFCSMTISAKGITEVEQYVIGPTDDSYLIVFGGSKSSRLFPKEIPMRPNQ